MSPIPKTTQYGADIQFNKPCPQLVNNLIVYARRNGMKITDIHASYEVMEKLLENLPNQNARDEVAKKQSLWGIKLFKDAVMGNDLMACDSTDPLNPQYLTLTFSEEDLS